MTPPLPAFGSRFGSTNFTQPACAVRVGGTSVDRLFLAIVQTRKTAESGGYPPSLKRPRTELNLQDVSRDPAIMSKSVAPDV
jgi:hypothetical protein